MSSVTAAQRLKATASMSTVTAYVLGALGAARRRSTPRPRGKGRAPGYTMPTLGDAGSEKGEAAMALRRWTLVGALLVAVSGAMFVDAGASARAVTTDLVLAERS